MKRNLLYLFLLLVTAALTYYFVFRNHEDNFDKKEVNFTVSNTDAIKKIFLSSLNGENLTFTQKNGEWVINDSIAAVQTLVQDLLAALRDQKAIQPVRLSYHDAVIKEMSTNSTKVEIYTDEGKTHCFYVAQNPSPDNLTYMLNEGAKRPYVVKLPLQNTFVGIRYNTKLANWRSKQILYTKAEDIESVEVSYLDSTQYSFRIDNQNPQSPRVSGNRTAEGPLNTKRVQTYLGLYDSLYCLGYETRNLIKDTILSSGHKLADVYLKCKGKPMQTLSLYFKPVTRGTKGMLKVGKEKYDFDVFIGFLNRQDMIVVTRNYAQMMLRSYPEFFEID